MKNLLYRFQLLTVITRLILSQNLLMNILRPDNFRLNQLHTRVFNQYDFQEVMQVDLIIMRSTFVVVHIRIA